MSDSVSKDNSKLSRYLSPAAVWALSFGCSVGWGAFVMPGTTFLPSAGPAGTVLGLVIGTVIMLIIGWNYHYMMQIHPDCGGTYSYTREELGYDHGFLSAWFLALTYIAIIWANVTAMALIIRNIFGSVLQFGFHYKISGYDIYFGEILIQLGVLILCGLLCIYGKKGAALTQTFFALLLIVGVIVCFFLVTGGKLQAADFEPMFKTGSAPARQILEIVMITPWAFIGFESISHSAEEFKFSVKKSFSIMAVALFTGLLGYVLPSLIAVAGRPGRYATWASYLADVADLRGIEGMPVFYALLSKAGNGAFIFLGLVVFSGIITGIIGNTVAVSRLLFAMAEDSILPAGFNKVNKTGSPSNILLFVVAISAVIPFFGRTAIGWIVDVTTVGATIAYGYASAAARKKAKKNGDRKTSILGMTGIVCSALFCLYLLIPNLWSISALAPESYLILAIWSIIGFFFFRYVFSRDLRHRFGQSSVVWLVLLFFIFFTAMMWTRRASVGKSSETFLVSSIIQMIIISVGLFVMFSLYMAMMEREKRLRAEKINAEESSKAKSIFLSNMSHDIRTPMNAIIGYINLAKRDDITLQELKEYLGKIEISSHHLLALINDVLEMSRIESGKMDLELVEVDLKKTLSEAHDMFMNQMERKSIEFTLDTKGIKTSRVYCDKNRLNRVLLNLISNACKFTPEGGKVAVIASQTESEVPQKGHYVLRIVDSGIGMTEEFAAKVFEAFERERTSTVSGIQGTGLGMAITKSIIDLMGGTIEVKSSPGEGTEFVINLSFELQEEGGAEEAEEKENGTEVKHSADFSNKRLLLTEDIEINREIAMIILKNLKFTVETAENGQEAVNMVAASKAGYYDAVLMDIQMPVMDGYDAARAIRSLEDEELSRIPIVAMTANAFSEDIKKARDAGMNSHIAKPIDINNLVSTLHEVLG